MPQYEFKVKNKQTEKVSTMTVTSAGDKAFAKAHIEQLPPSRGASKGFEVLGLVDAPPPKADENLPPPTAAETK